MARYGADELGHALLFAGAAPIRNAARYLTQKPRSNRARRDYLLGTLAFHGLEWHHLDGPLRDA